MDYVSREQWGARAPKGKTILAPSAIEGIFVHHTVTDDGDADLADTSDEKQIMRDVQRFHMDTRGWKDIAYNWAIGQSGAIYEGRGWLLGGGHTEGWNLRSHAVVFIGTSDGDGDGDRTDGDFGSAHPTPAALRSMNVVIEESLRRFGGFVRPHRAVNATGCPGDFLANWLANGRPSAPLPTLPISPIPTPDEDDMEPAIILRNVFTAPYLCPNAGKNGLAILLKSAEDVAFAKFLGAQERPGDGTPFLRLMHKVSA